MPKSNKFKDHPSWLAGTAAARPSRAILLVLFLIPATAESDVLRLLVWEGYAPEAYVREFESTIEAKYGRRVKLDVEYVTGSDDLYDPIRQKTADVVTITHHHFKDERFRYVAANLLLPIDTANLPNLENLLPALRGADYLMQNEMKYGVPICQGPYGLAYNTQKVEVAPDTWKVLWEPQYRGTYMLGANDYLYNVIVAALAWGYPRDAIADYDTLNTADFRTKLRQLAVNAHSFWIGTDTADELAGKSLAGAWGDSFTDLRERGETWKMAMPKEGTPFWVDNYALTWALADKPYLRKVAEEWIDRLLDPSYQVDFLIRQLSQTPVTTDIDEWLTDAERERLRLRGEDAGTRVLLPTCSRRNRNGLMLLWREAMEDVEVREGDAE